MRRAFVSLLALAACLMAQGIALAKGSRPDGPGYLDVQAAALVDRQTGRVLWQMSGYNRRAPASTTKLLTAVVAVQRGRLDEVFEVSRRAASVSGSSAQIGPGERYPLRELLEGMLLRSGNDAAHAIAESVGGTMPHFMELANDEAVRMGARQTHFVNPHGLTASHHYTTATDLAIIARTAISSPEIARIVSSQELVFEQEGGHGRTIRNTNQLLGSYLGADGAKTGTTSAAGKCLVASATRGDVRLIAVLLHGGDRYGAARTLLDYGFSHYGAGVSIPEGSDFGRLPDGRATRLGAPLSAARPIGQPVHLRVRLMPDPPAQGGIVGQAVLMRGEAPVAAAPLLAGALPRPWFWRLLPGLRAVDPPSLESL